MNKTDVPKSRRQSLLARKSLISLVVLSLAYGIFLVGYFAGQGQSLSYPRVKDVKNINVGKPQDVDFSLYWEAWNKLRSKAAVDSDPKKMLEGSIAGMAASLGDPYTAYFTEEQNKRFREDISGEFGGIGVEITLKNDLPTVVAPLSETPAERAGIKPGAVILEVDGQKTSDIGFDATIDRIRGNAGTKVKLKLLQDKDTEPTEIEVVRDTIVVKSVKWEYKDVNGKKILYIKVRQFGDDTAALFSEAAAEATKTKPSGIIVDLRNNPGGYLGSSVDLASHFLDGGVVVSEKGRNGESKDYKTSGNADLKNFKVTVLVNKGSASASEIFSGALQDRGKAKLIGDKTFGKGSVQELVGLSDNSSLKVTIAKWYTPNGRQISDQGIEPDISIADDDKTADDEQLNRALQYFAE